MGWSDRADCMNQCRIDDLFWRPLHKRGYDDKFRPGNNTGKRALRRKDKSSKPEIYGDSDENQERRLRDIGSNINLLSTKRQLNSHKKRSFNEDNQRRLGYYNRNLVGNCENFCRAAMDKSKLTNCVLQCNKRAKAAARKRTLYN